MISRRRLFLGIALMMVLLLGTGSVIAAPSGEIKQWLDSVGKNYRGTTLTVAIATHPSTDAFKKIVVPFEEATGIKVIWDAMENVYLKDKQLMEFASRTGRYDILGMDGFWLDEYVAKKVVIPLDDYLSDATKTPPWFDYADIEPAYNSLAVLDGKVYGIPAAGESRFIAYRKDLFEKYGKKPPKTTAELLELAQFFNGREPGLYGIALRAQRGTYFSSGWLQIIYNFGGGFIDQKTGKPTMTNPATVESLDYWVKLLKCGPPDTPNYSHEEATSAFTSGKTAMWFDATALVPWIEDPSKSKVAGKVGYAPPPEGPAGAYAAIAGWSLAISSQSKNKDAAWALIVWLLSRANASDYFNAGGVPTRTSTLKDPALIKTRPDFPAQLESLQRAANLVKKGIRWIPPTPDLGKILETTGYYGSLALVGEMTPKAACEAAQRDLMDIVSP